MKVTKKSTKLIFKISIATLLTLAMVVTGLGIYFSSNKKTPPTVVDPISWATDTWDGETKDETNWVDAYAGRDNKTYTITSAAGFAYFISVVNNENLAKEYNYFKDYTVYLNNNIDLANKVTESIGKKITVQGEVTSTFQGTFDGGFYTIFNARIDGNGLFGYTHNATIKNVGLYNATISSSSEYAGAILGEGVNTSIENCYARLGRVISQNAAGLVGKLTLNNTTSSETSMGSLVGSMPNTDVKILNSFADLELKGTTGNYGLIANYVSNGNELEIDTCYYTNATQTLGGDVEDVKETEVIANPKRNSFSNWSYTKEYSLDVMWCNYSHIEGSEKLNFNYPILSMFNKVFMTGSGYENTVTNSEGEVKNVVTIADAFKLALEDTSKEVEVNILVEKIFMQETAVVEESTKVSLNTAVETTLVRGEANPEMMIVGTYNSSLT